jgi:hypothetical protein
MLDIVAANQDEPATAIDRRGVDHGKARLAPARGGSAHARCTEAADQPRRRDNEHEHHREGQNELERQWQFGTEHVEHRSLLPTGSPSDRSRTVNTARQDLPRRTLRYG